MSNEDPFMEMAAAAVAFRKLFDAYVAAGFTEAQALQICLALQTNWMQTNPAA